MIVWGGVDYSNVYQSGGRYNPETDSWVATSLRHAPHSRGGFSTVWTGGEMIIWAGAYEGTFTNSGGGTIR